MRKIVVVALCFFCMFFFMFYISEEPNISENTVSTKQLPTINIIENKMVVEDEKDQEKFIITHTILNGYVIGIDAGHQEKADLQTESVSPFLKTTKPRCSSGTKGIVTNKPEYVLNLEVALKLRDLLVEKGATVIMSRETHKINISNIERAQLFNHNNADIAIRIHADGSTNEKTKGMTMLIPAMGCMIMPELEEESKKIGEILLNSAVSMTEAKNLGLITRDDLTGFCWSEVPVCLIEMGFMTNKEEDTMLSTQEYQQKIAQGLCNGITEYFTTNTNNKKENKP